MLRLPRPNCPMQTAPNESAAATSRDLDRRCSGGGTNPGCPWRIEMSFLGASPFSRVSADFVRVVVMRGLEQAPLHQTLRVICENACSKVADFSIPNARGARKN